MIDTSMANTSSGHYSGGQMYTTDDGREFMCFKNAESMLEALRENSRASSPEGRVREGYVFRGHGNSKWLLEPSVVRKWNPPWKIQDRERYTDAFVRDLQVARRELNIPGDDMLSLFAIAQHYGFPTALLDFSCNFEVAAAFACNDPGKGEYGVVYEMTLKSLEDLVNPFGPVG